MARITKKKGSSKLYLDYKLLGKRMQRSTGMEDTEENRHILETEVIPNLEAKIKLGMIEPERDESFKYYGLEYKVSKKESKSYDQKRYVIEKVIEYFENKKVRSITRLDVKKYLNTLEVKTDSKRPYLTAIRGILGIALDDEAIKRNVASGIELRSEEEEDEIEPFSHEEVKLILDNTEGMLRNYLGIAFYQGFRPGETLGIMRSEAIDALKENKISIKRSISKGKITTPKTKSSIREVPLFEMAIPFIEDQLKRSTSFYLFDIDGKYVRDINAIMQRRWTKLLEKLGIEYRKAYNTRHTFITAMLNSGEYKMMDIAKMVGHKNIRMIVEHYAGFIKDDHLRVNVKTDIFGRKDIG